MVKSLRFVLIIMLIFVSVLITGCQAKEKAVVKIKDLEFTIVEEGNIPEELKTIIEAKKKETFKLSYSDTEYLYIVVGYGEQSTGGYSIAVDELYLAENAVYINTNLIGPAKEEVVTRTLTYPYVVVKTEYLDKSVVFH